MRNLILHAIASKCQSWKRILYEECHQEQSRFQRSAPVWSQETVSEPSGLVRLGMQLGSVSGTEIENAPLLGKSSIEL